MIEENVENAMYAKELEALYLNQTNTVKSYLLTGDETYITQYEEYLEKANETIKNMLKTYQSKEDIEMIEQLSAFQTRNDEIVQKEIMLKKSRRYNGVYKFNEYVRKNHCECFPEKN